MQTASLGYPRLGARRELKRALESYWSGKSSATMLEETGKQLRLAHWQLQRDAGIDSIPSNDFSLYDHVLDTSLMVGAVPERYAQAGELSALDTYFAMARGIQRDGVDIPAMEMTKWFATNYHYIVPEIAVGQPFRFASTKVLDEFIEAREAGILTRPVLLGPVSYLLLSKPAHGLKETPLAALPALLEVYAEVLRRLADAGADWVQIDEPCLVLDLDQAARAAYLEAYAALPQVANVRILLATYFGELGENLPLVASLPVAGLHIDLVRALGQLDAVLAHLPAERDLSLGLVDGRNVWRTDLDAALTLARRALAGRDPARITIAPSCSLIFSPHDLALETELDTELASWLAFARQKVDELVILKRALEEGEGAVHVPLAASRAAMESRRNSPRTRNPQVRTRLAEVDEAMLRRESSYAARQTRQVARFALPPLPTTTIGSFPQTVEVRAQRAAFNKGTISRESYEEYLRAEIARTVRMQEDLGLDVLVHGECERTDMVEYFGTQLTGFAFTQHGWVQSYGSRAVRPPIIFGDVARPAPMTVDWSTYAQSLTARPMKGMLTGPVTILEWSFVRDDQPRATTCAQIALALRDEVRDLEEAGIGIVQIDEPALREGLPLRRAEQGEYLRWAIDAFRLASCGVGDETQIHTHMCYAEFNDIIEAIGQMDADVISIEASRSKMELLDAFKRYDYPNEIGPGVYDIHSPRIPTREEMVELLHEAARTLSARQLWVNPDCGLKTRRWEEVRPALGNMVAAAHEARAVLAAAPTRG
jgi:5-methyltetrahydropteroyltriglutamate--homocysteine methyltransferase